MIRRFLARVFRRPRAELQSLQQVLDRTRGENEQLARDSAELAERVKRNAIKGRQWLSGKPST